MQYQFAFGEMIHLSVIEDSIEFAPKYRRKIFYREKRAEIGKILRELYTWKGVNIIKAEVCVDHIYVGRNTAENECVKFHGVFKGKK